MIVSNVINPAIKWLTASCFDPCRVFLKRPSDSTVQTYKYMYMYTLARYFMESPKEIASICPMVSALVPLECSSRN